KHSTLNFLKKCDVSNKNNANVSFRPSYSQKQHPHTANSASRCAGVDRALLFIVFSGMNIQLAGKIIFE
ncbi:hypothetical protein, partial [Lacticaseibacillus casei]|uniref:hypothetical protein n=2 Tax=Lacticaseibacillus TaxID=2759736 RepID=UPI001AA095D4